MRRTVLHKRIHPVHPETAPKLPPCLPAFRPHLPGSASSRQAACPLVESNDGQVTRAAPPLAEEQTDAGSEYDREQVRKHKQRQHFTNHTLPNDARVPQRQTGLARLPAILEVTHGHR